MTTIQDRLRRGPVLLTGLRRSLRSAGYLSPRFLFGLILLLLLSGFWRPRSGDLQQDRPHEVCGAAVRSAVVGSLVGHG